MRGFSLAEVLVALTLLSFCLLALATLFPLETRLTQTNEVSTQTSSLAQRELSQIWAQVLPPPPGGQFVDLSGNTVDVNCQGPPGTSCGNPLTASGLIDFTQAPPVGFSEKISAANGQQFSLRWNISVTASNGRKIIVAAQALNPQGGMAPVVQFQTLKAP
jgi:prepilin-type N-terminal cleavage/methylation domain-containing protein